MTAISKKIQFLDVLNIVCKRLCNRLDITTWEQKRISSRQVREWLTRIDKLVSLGFLRPNRRRRDRMPTELTGFGESALRTISANVISDATELLARCLVGCGPSSKAIKRDTVSAKKLKRWLEFQNAELRIALVGASAGFSEVTFQGQSPISRSHEKLFVIVLAVAHLTTEDVDRLVTPYRRQ